MKNFAAPSPRRSSRTCKQLGIFYVFKASFDKANRTSGKSFRGPGIKNGLKTLAKIRAEFEVPGFDRCSHRSAGRRCGRGRDILQIPAFLCRQTDLIEAAVATGKIVNLKKGQFLSPNEMGRVAEKARLAGAKKILLTERGTTLRLQQSRRRHARDSDHESVRLPGDF